LQDHGDVNCSRSLLICGILGFLSSTGYAQTNSWTNPSTSKWETPGNWSLGAAPNGSQSVYITNAGFKLVQMDATTASSSTVMTSANVTVSGTGNVSNRLSIAGTGSLTPFVITTGLSIGPAGSLAIANGIVQYTGGIANLDSDLRILSGGSFALGSTLLVAGSVGQTGRIVVIDGQLTNSASLRLGSSGHGLLSMTGGTVSFAGGSVGFFSNSSGRVSLSGGKLMLTSQMNIGDNHTVATGTLTVDGGTLEFTTLKLGLPGLGILNLESGSAQGWWLLMGEAPKSRGRLTINGGSLSLALPLWIAQGAGSTSEVWICGGQLTTTNISFFSGTTGYGKMICSNGVVSCGDFSIASGHDLQIVGGTVTVTRQMNISGCGGNPAVTLASGSLYVTNPTHTARLRFSNGGTFNMTGGTLVVDQLIASNACAQFIQTGGTVSIGALFLDASQDTDGDGLPNGWEQTFDFSPLRPTGNDGPEGDPDGDGFTNLQEFLAGTDPTDSTSALQITDISRAGVDINVSWTSAAGKTYQLHRYDSLVTTNAIDIGAAVLGTGSPVSQTDFGAMTNLAPQFYRVLLVP